MTTFSQYISLLHVLPYIMPYNHMMDPSIECHPFHLEMSQLVSNSENIPFDIQRIQGKFRIMLCIH